MCRATEVHQPGLAVCTASGKGFPGKTSTKIIESHEPMGFPTPPDPGQTTTSLDHLNIARARPAGHEQGASRSAFLKSCCFAIIYPSHIAIAVPEVRPRPKKPQARSKSR